ncbi:hypothetical protein R1flu_014662 [Riccia fluitans]|uniref:Uncharacterized protein n=1 Tax=Riccia fluitans TaxID=41844 RepID=A0ABD1YH42_9MARC
MIEEEEMGSVLQEKLWVAGKYAIVVIVLLSVLPILLPSAIILSLLFFTFVLPLLCGVAGLFLLQIHAMMLYRSLVAEYEKIIAPALRFAVLLLLGLFREPQSNGVMENAGGPERLREETGNPVVRVAHDEVDLQGPREERVDLEVRVMQNEAVSNWLREQGTDLVLRVMQNEADLQRRNPANLEWPREGGVNLVAPLPEFCTYNRQISGVRIDERESALVSPSVFSRMSNSISSHILRIRSSRKRGRRRSELVHSEARPYETNGSSYTHVPARVSASITNHILRTRSRTIKH